MQANVERLKRVNNVAVHMARKPTHVSQDLGHCLLLCHLCKVQVEHVVDGEHQEQTRQITNLGDASQLH